jgi:hypothetical protein
VRLGAQRVDPGEVHQLFNPIRSLVRWIDAMQVKCPDLSRQDIVWVFSYLSGLIFSRQLIHHQYDMFLEADGDPPSVDQVTGDIVAFGCAGVDAIRQRRVAAFESRAEARRMEALQANPAKTAPDLRASVGTTVHT